MLMEKNKLILWSTDRGKILRTIIFYKSDEYERKNFNNFVVRISKNFVVKKILA